MPLDPFFAPTLPLPPMGEIADYPAFRAQGESMEAALAAQVAEPGPAVLERRIERIPVSGGTIELVIVRPDDRPSLPVHVHFHGGGWITGDAKGAFTGVLASERAVETGCVVVLVNYRKAPEHPFPIPLFDCQAGFEWVIANAGALGIDPTRVTVGGGSAGGNLAAALALKVRDEHGPAIALQLLEVPTLDLTLQLPSHADPDLGSQYALHAPDFALMVRAYLSGGASAADPYVSPLLASDITGLAPAFVMVAELDMLRDDGTRFYEKLRAAGVPAGLYVGEGLVHGSQAFTKVLPGARAWREELFRVLRAANEGRLTL